jgi:hypothetical protein
MNNINNCLPNFNLEDTDVLCSDAYGNMAVGKLEYDDFFNHYICVKCIAFQHVIVLRGVAYWKFTSEIFNGLAASELKESILTN